MVAVSMPASPRGSTTKPMLFVGALGFVFLVAMPFFFAQQSPNRDLYAGSLSSGDMKRSHATSVQFRSVGAMLKESSMEERMRPSVQDGNVFAQHEPNQFHRVSEEPVSTFSADVDTTSYSYVRRLLNDRELPRRDMIRTEEMINYFDYDYPVPSNKTVPFEPSVAISDCPWSSESDQGHRKLLHFGIKGYQVQRDSKPRSNLVLLLDVSGSMQGQDRLELVRDSMKLLLNSLDSEDSVAIVTYASGTNVALPSTKVSQKRKILRALDALRAGGATAGADGLKLAYKVAEDAFDREAVNRILLASDGDFNVGPSNNDKLKSLIEKHRETGIYLSVLGVGMGNFRDDHMSTLANHGNGVAAYIDNIMEAKKILVEEASSTLFPIAKDVKIQVEFNPERIQEYRLLGYEKRMLNREDFNNDKIDAGDIGSGHSVTAMYEVVLAGSNRPVVEPLRYAKEQNAADNNSTLPHAGELAFFKLRYKLPNEDKSRLLERPITDRDDIGRLLESSKQDTTMLSKESQSTAVLKREAVFATSVAWFAQTLQSVPHIDKDFKKMKDLANKNSGDDEFGYRSEFIGLLRQAEAVMKEGVYSVIEEEETPEDDSESISVAWH